MQTTNGDQKKKKKHGEIHEDHIKAEGTLPGLWSTAAVAAKWGSFHAINQVTGA